MSDSIPVPSFSTTNTSSITAAPTTNTTISNEQKEKEKETKISELKKEIKDLEKKMDNDRKELDDANKNLITTQENLKLNPDNENLKKKIVIYDEAVETLTDARNKCRRKIEKIEIELNPEESHPSTPKDALSTAAIKPLSPVRPMPSSDDLVTFWAQLRSIEWIDEPNKIIELPSDVCWFGSNVCGNKLMIRQSYMDILTLMLKQQESKPHFVQGLLLGNPGIGKSWFLYYVMAHIVKFKIPDVYILFQDPQKGGILFHESNIFQGSPRSLFSTLAKPFHNCYYLIDSSVPDPFIYNRLTKNILVSSPDKSIYKEFEKYLTLTTPHYLPTWSWEEISLCHQSCFPSLLPSVVEGLYFKFGGIPRDVLQKADVEGAEDILEESILAGNLEDLKDSIGEIQEKVGASHKILHYEVETPGYRKNVVKFASSYVAEKVTTRLLLKQRNDVISFITASDPSPSSHGFAGNLFEGIIHSTLRNGGKFKVRNLETSSDSSISMGPEFVILGQTTQEKIINSQSEMSIVPVGTYCRPLSRSFAAIDSLFLRSSSQCFLFQSTVSLNHPIKRKRLLDIMRDMKLPSAATVTFFFVVPMSIFPLYKKQNYELITEEKSDKRSDDKKQPKLVCEDQNIPGVAQFVLGIDLSSSGTSSSSTEFSSLSTLTSPAGSATSISTSTSSLQSIGESMSSSSAPSPMVDTDPTIPIQPIEEINVNKRRKIEEDPQ